MTLEFTLRHTDAYQSLLEMHVARLCKQLGLNKRVCFQINLIVDEICTNILQNNSQSKNLRIDVSFSWSKERITVVIEDNGVPFDPTSTDEPDISLPLSKREAGGLGLYFVKKYTDTFTYSQQEGGNRTTVTKTLDPPQTSSTQTKQ